MRFFTGSGNTAVSRMRNASGHNYWNSSFITDVAMGQIYHVSQNAFLVISTISRMLCVADRQNTTQSCMLPHTTKQTIAVILLCSVCISRVFSRVLCVLCWLRLCDGESCEIVSTSRA